MALRLGNGVTRAGKITNTLRNYAMKPHKKNPAAVALGRLGGKVKSPRKAETSRDNGRKNVGKKSSRTVTNVSLDRRMESNEQDRE